MIKLNSLLHTSSFGISSSFTTHCNYKYKYTQNNRFYSNTSTITKPLSKDQLKEQLDNLKEPDIPEFCCGNGCANCVWEDYFKAMKKYEETKKNLENELQKEVDPT
jgi:hypothetical protein